MMVVRLKGHVGSAPKAVKPPVGYHEGDDRDWREWLQDEIRSLPVAERLEILVGSIKYNNDLPITGRFIWAERVRDFADQMERAVT
jgi:hypothetical protein